MTRAELIRVQAAGAVRNLHSLAMGARGRFLRAAALVGATGPEIPALCEWGRQTVDLAPLLPAWDRLCKRYMEEHYDPQMTLIPAASPTDPELAWSRFVHWHLFPYLLREDEVVRNILRALGGLPAIDPGGAAEAIYLYMVEMKLPDRPPPWDPCPV